MRWIDATWPTIEENLALDEALLVEAEESAAGASVRTWEWPGWSVVLGASCRIAADVDRDACSADGVAIARRSSGGGSVLIGPGAMNVTVVLPIDSDPRLSAVDTSQELLLGRLAEALRGRGVPVAVLGSGDLTVDGRKVSGSAQRRLRRNVMIHASILYDFPISRIGRYLRLPERQPAYRRGRSHEDFLANLPIRRDELMDAVRSAWLNPGETPGAAGPPESLIRGLVSAKFGAPGWVDRL